ncbi:MAG: hypothetical protein LBM38_03265 [Clostridiales bacterium]|jgi:hypothetical protein|nr:hypothetical protein [Clostridiales bacterium]
MEKIIAAMVQFKNGDFYMGSNHGLAMQRAINAGEKREELHAPGFITSEGRLLNRKQAYTVAKEADQFPEDYKPMLYGVWLDSGEIFGDNSVSPPDFELAVKFEGRNNSSVDKKPLIELAYIDPEKQCNVSKKGNTLNTR